MKSIIGPFVLREGNLTEDQKQATDLIVLTAGVLRIACRLRREGYSKRFPYDVTVTCKRETGAPCEWDKMILRGWGNWFFYGHQLGNEIAPWYLVDLAVCRSWMKEHPGEMRRNLDAPGRGCFFYAFDVRQFPAKSIIGWSA